MDILLKLDEANQLDLLPITDLKDKILRQHTKLSFFSIRRATGARFIKSE
jgi:hypothetical protein